MVAGAGVEVGLPVVDGCCVAVVVVLVDCPGAAVVVEALVVVEVGLAVVVVEPPWPDPPEVKNVQYPVGGGDVVKSTWKLKLIWGGFPAWLPLTSYHLPSLVELLFVICHSYFVEDESMRKDVY